MTVDILILTDSREQRRSQKKYWYSMKCDLNGELKKTEGTGQIDGTYHQATLAALISAMRRLKRPADVCIHTQDRYVRSAIAEACRSGQKTDLWQQAGGSWRIGRSGRRYGDIQRGTESQRQGEGRKAPTRANTRQHAPKRTNTL